MSKGYVEKVRRWVDLFGEFPDVSLREILEFDDLGEVAEGVVEMLNAVVRRC